MEVDLTELNPMDGQGQQGEKKSEFQNQNYFQTSLLYVFTITTYRQS